MKDKKYLINCLYAPNKYMRNPAQFTKFFEEIFDNRMYGEYDNL